MYNVFERKKCILIPMHASNHQNRKMTVNQTGYYYTPLLFSNRIYLSILRLFTLNENSVIIEFNKNSMVILFRSSKRLKPITINDL